MEHNMQFAEKMRYFDHSVFTKLEKMRKEAETEDRPVLDLSIGTPDLPPDERVMETLAEASRHLN